MMADYYSALSGLLPVILIVCINGLFVAAEFALVRSSITKLKGPELKDAYGTETALKLLEYLDQSISTTQLGITVMSLVLGWYGESVFHALFIGLFSWAPGRYQLFLTTTAATACALALVTFLHVVAGELVAKAIAIRFPETCLRIVGGPVLIVSTIFRPFVFFLNNSANLVLRLFGLSTSLSSERIHSTGELAMLITQSSEQGVLDKDEEEMLHGVFGFSETIAREVMTPRTDLVSVPGDATFHEVIATISKSGFSRFPVVNDGIDNVAGILLSRDLLPVCERYIGQNAKPFSVKDIMREPYFIPGTKSINDLLKEFKQRKLHMAIVLDEHGGVDGAVTLEDLIEEIVGDIYDESDVGEAEVLVDPSGDVLLDGGILVDDINERFELLIPEGEYDTLAGFVMSSLGKVPSPGDQVAISSQGIPMIPSNDEGYRVVDDYKNGHSSNGDSADLTETDFAAPKAVFIVERVTGNRIESIRLHTVNDTLDALQTAE